MDEKYKYVQGQLVRRCALKQLAQVARKTHLSRRTLGYIMEGRDVRLTTLLALHKFLKKHEASQEI